MTMRVLFFLIKLGLLGALVAYFAANPGHATVEFRGWRLDMPFGFLLLLLLVLAILIAYADRIRRGITRLPERIGNYRKQNRMTKGYQALTQGLVAAAAGDAPEAARQAKRAQALLDNPALTRLLSAQAAQLNGQDDAARDYFEGMLHDKNTAFMGIRGLMMQAIKSGDREAALSLAEQAYSLRPGTPWVLRELLDLQTEQDQIEAALQTLDRATREKALPVADIQKRKVALLLTRARQLRRDGLTRTALKLARQALKVDPLSIEAVRIAAPLYREEGKSRKADKLVEDVWRTQPDPLLADLYRTLAPADANHDVQMKRAKRLASLNPDDPESRLLLAMASLDAGQPTEARDHLAPLTSGTPSARVCRLMARIETETNQDMAAARLWLDRAASLDQGEDDFDSESLDVLSDDTHSDTATASKGKPANKEKTKPSDTSDPEAINSPIPDVAAPRSMSSAGVVDIPAPPDIAAPRPKTSENRQSGVAKKG